MTTTLGVALRSMRTVAPNAPQALAPRCDRREPVKPPSQGSEQPDGAESVPEGRVDDGVSVFQAL